MHVYRVFLSGLLNPDTLDDEAPVGTFHMLLRRVHDNTGCATFLGRLPVRTIHAPSSPTYHWYTFSDHAPYNHAGISISTRRKAVPRLSQQRLAFLACMDPSTLAMVETGHRVLRADDARRLRDILCHSPQDELRYASDILACTFNASLWTYPSALGSELSDVEQTLWVFSDELAENTSSDAIMLSSTALRNGRDRYFFVPPKYEQDDIRMICRLIVNHFCLNQYNTDILLERLRFYRAPGSLCSLRLAVHDPDPAPGSPSARKLSVAAGDTMRLDVAHTGDALLTRFLEYIKKRILYADLSPGSTSEGFGRIDINELLAVSPRPSAGA